MQGIKIYKRPQLKDPYLIVAWPGMGEVAFKAAHYLVEKLPAKEFAQIPAQDFFYLTAATIKEGRLTLPELPENKFYYWKNLRGAHDLIIFLSATQPDLAEAQSYSRRILEVAKIFKVKMVIGFAAMPQTIDHAQEPGVWFSATSGQLVEQLKKYNLHLLSEGQISGMNGLFLGFAKKEGLDSFCLLGEIPLYTIQIENPRASKAVLETLGRILGMEIDLTSLADQARLMEEEINKLLEYLKLGPATLSPIGEEEIEKIKKFLTQLTRLPISVKEKIEKLFAQSKTDISHAKELKKELDKWNVYKEYEDRFLDLFKKSEGQGN